MEWKGETDEKGINYFLKILLGPDTYHVKARDLPKLPSGQRFSPRSLVPSDPSRPGSWVQTIQNLETEKWSEVTENLPTLD